MILPDTIRMKDKQSPNILENTNFDVKEKSNLIRRLKKKVGVKFTVAFVI